MKKFHVLSSTNNRDMKINTNAHTIGNLDMYFSADTEAVSFYLGEPDGVEEITIDCLDCLTPCQQYAAKQYLADNYRQIENELLNAITPAHYAWLDDVAAEMMIN